MTNLKHALFLAIAAGFFLLVGAAPFTVALFFGFAWGFIACLPVAYGLARLSAHLEMDGGAEVIIFGGLSLVVGLIAGTVWGLVT